MPNEELVGAGTGALKGAAAGAVVGSVVPGIGTGIGALAGGLIGGVSGFFGGSERKNARRDQQRAVNAGIASQEKMFNKSVALQEPWRQAGLESLGTLRQGLAEGRYTMVPSSFNYQEQDYTAPTYRGGPRYQEEDFNFQADPGYQFRLKEGEKAIQRSAAARGNLMSGGTMKALAQYGQGMASQEYSNAYGRFDRDRQFGRGVYESDRAFGRGSFESDRGFGRGNYLQDRAFGYGSAQDDYNRRSASLSDRYNRLAGMSGTGQVVSGNLGSQAMAQGGNLAEMYAQQGNINAAGHMATAGMMESLPNFALQAGMVYGGLRQPGVGYGVTGSPSQVSYGSPSQVSYGSSGFPSRVPLRYSGNLADY